MRELKGLGTNNSDLLRIEMQSLFNVDTLLVKAEARRSLREAAGISDSVEACQPTIGPRGMYDL